MIEKIPKILKADPAYVAKQLTAWGVIWAFIAGVTTATGYNIVFEKDFEAHVHLMNEVTCEDVEFFYNRAVDARNALPPGQSISAVELKELSRLERQMDLFNCQRLHR